MRLYGVTNTNMLVSKKHHGSNVTHHSPNGSLWNNLHLICEDWVHVGFCHDKFFPANLSSTKPGEFGLSM